MNYEGMTVIIYCGILILLMVLLKLLKRQICRWRLFHSTNFKKVDRMNGHEFEEFLVVLFSHHGYEAKKTKGSGDFGVDLILKKEGRIIAVQAKRYKQKVNLQAVQEVAAGKNYYGATDAWVITNSFYTDSAKALAAPNDVTLLNRYDLERLMNQAKNKLKK